jgi:hypothetical protein
VDAVNYGQIIVATVKEMRATAKARGVKAYYKMNKSQLERAIGATGSSKRSAPGNKRAQATARKSGAATSFGAEKLAAKYGVEKQDLVKGAKKALRQAEKAKGGKLTPQEKRKAVAASLSAQTKIDRSTAGMIRSMKRNAPDAYEGTTRAFADMPFSKVRKKATVMLSAIEKKAKGKSKKTTQPFAKPVMELLDSKAATDAAMGKLQKQKSAIEKKAKGKSKKTTQPGEAMLNPWKNAPDPKGAKFDFDMGQKYQKGVVADRRRAKAARLGEASISERMRRGKTESYYDTQAASGRMQAAADQGMSKKRLKRTKTTAQKHAYYAVRNGSTMNAIDEAKSRRNASKKNRSRRFDDLDFPKGAPDPKGAKFDFDMGQKYQKGVVADRRRAKAARLGEASISERMRRGKTESYYDTQAASGRMQAAADQGMSKKRLKRTKTTAQKHAYYAVRNGSTMNAIDEAKSRRNTSKRRR